MKMRILNVEPQEYSPAARAILDGIGEVHAEACNRERLLALVPEFEVLIVRLGHRIDEGVLKRAERLRAIVTATTGLNHIDLDAAQSCGVAVLSLRGEREFLNSITATAEMTWGLLLSLSRRLPAAFEHVRDGEWDRDQFKGHQLSRKTLGVVGCGRLGSIVADYGRAFRMRVLVNDPRDVELPEQAIKVPLHELLSASDVVTLHVGLDESTEGFFGEAEFRAMKPGALFINTSRGELVDETALLSALRSGRIAGAALDVLTGESARAPDWPSRSAIWQFSKGRDNVLISPHIGGATVNSMADTEIFMAKKLASFLENAEFISAR